MSPFIQGHLMPRVDIVCTTIGDGSFLKSYAEEILAAGAQDRTRIIVISDHKTDHKKMNSAVVDAWDAGISVDCPGLAEQVDFMSALGEPDMFRWNSDGRRNIGYLMSWRDGADIMISVDDDNLPEPGWLKGHEIVTAPAGLHDVITSDDGFFNHCDLLRAEPDVRFWPRGYPYGKRGSASALRLPVICEVAINAGLWLGDPDVDAITRLALAPQALSLKGSVVLGPGTYAPVNSQNTAIRRDVIPAYCYFENTKRFADIWQGYFAQKCAQHFAHGTRFGTPLAVQDRNEHDLLNDLALEYDGIMMLDPVLEWLAGVTLTGSTYAETYASLQHELLEYVGRTHDLSQRAHGLMYDIAVRMDDWLTIIARLS